MEYRVDLGINIWKKKGRKYTFWAFSGHVYRHTLNVYRYTLPEPNVYRYMLGVYRYTLFCFSSFDQFLYFDHNLLIYDPI